MATLIDHIPKWVHHPRSPAPKRRTDFSSFFCSSSFPYLQGHLLESPDSKDVVPTVASTSPDDSSGKGEHIHNIPQIQCYRSTSRGRLSLQSDENQAMEGQSSPRNGLTSHHIVRSLGIHKGQVVSKVEVVLQEQEEATGSNDCNRTPASNGKPRPSPSKWLAKHVKIASNSNNQDQASGKNTWSSSSRTEDDFQETGRGKRKRKPKLHFDEWEPSVIKSEKRARRVRIMRYLGLAAPVGSPFILPS